MRPPLKTPLRKANYRHYIKQAALCQPIFRKKP
jgi:hypothetical protein